MSMHHILAEMDHFLTKEPSAFSHMPITYYDTKSYKSEHFILIISTVKLEREHKAIFTLMSNELSRCVCSSRFRFGNAHLIKFNNIMN